MSMLNPYAPGYSLLPFESKFLIIFWIIGVAFFVGGWYVIRKILFEKFEDEINIISNLCRLKTQQLSNLVSKDDSNQIDKHLNQISNTLDALHKERERILEFGARPMDIKTLLLFLGSSIPSLIAIINTLETLGEASKIEPAAQILNNSSNIVNHLVNYSHHIWT